MDITSRIAFERAWGKANRLPEEERAIAPTGQVAYAHGVAAGEAKNREEAFASDVAFRESAGEEKGREFGLSTEEKSRQVLTDLDSRYTQAVQEMDERERQFGGRLSWTGERVGKTLGEQERQFGGRLTASGSQFERRLAAESDIFEKRLGESSYESGMLFNQKTTQFEQELTFRAQKFDDEIAWGREKFDKTLSFQDRVFLDKIANERRQLDTWIQSNRIGAVIELANTALSAYGMNKAIEQRKEMLAAQKEAAWEAKTGRIESSYTAALFNAEQKRNNLFNKSRFDVDPDYLKKGNYVISEPVQQGTMSVSKPVPLSDIAKYWRNYWRDKEEPMMLWGGS